MEVAEALGFIQFWGMTPSINFFEDEEFVASKKRINVLLSGVSDLRHLLKTLFEICKIKEKFKDKEIRIYLHEIKKENIARSCLLLHVLNLTNISARERLELFLDIYGNCFVKEKTSDFVSDSVKELTRLFTDEAKCQLPIRKLIDLSMLKSKDRDDFLDIISSWNKQVQFKMDELRDQRLRYHYKERFDARLNLIDWDYQMDLKQDAPIIHYWHYKNWRQTGNAYEQRFSSHIVPNRTMGSYIPGRSKKTRDSILVRGFWGDIIISPYIAFGIEADTEPENKELFKIMNMQQRYTSVDVTNFNFNSFIKMFEDFEVYHLPKEEEQPPAEPEKKAMDKIEEQEEEKEEEKETHEIETSKEKVERPVVPLADIPLMPGFTTFDLKIYPICEDIDRISKKSNLKQTFDIIVIGIPQLALIKEEELPRILSPTGTLLYLEAPKFMLPIKKKERPEMRVNLAKLPEVFGFEFEPFQKDHHIKFRRQPAEPSQ